MTASRLRDEPRIAFLGMTERCARFCVREARPRRNTCQGTWPAMPTERQILIIDDDSALSAMLSELLSEDNEFIPVAVASLNEASLKLGSGSDRYDAVLL